ncbi:hypothetical protein GN958_ATG05448 [Phytophthora infestans]|uniref:MULE transposase domain-containing protein n=1 Tax=Phytophthora infestans TaxID=4787 RepID=A0A8S9V4L0_PHYIN|nr:hypothetical protein GN958_ATG05448 [Phytophthora infestans]
MTDKAVHEKDVLQEAFPDARQWLCQWHVVTWLKEQVVRYAPKVQKEVKGIMKALVYSRSEQEYIDCKAALLSKLDSNEDHPLYVTFSKNLDVNSDEWVSYKRGNVPHLQNNTNNRIESKWGKIKHVVDATFKIDELISMLITLRNYAEEQNSLNFIASEAAQQWLKILS